MRAYDADGRLHVELTPISKANVCPYYGKEIPDFEALGLDPDKVYQLYRDPDELEKAAPSFNNLPLLSRHVPVTADSHQPDLVVGSTGTDAVFEAPYLKNSLVIWARDAIGGVESSAQKELSCAYRYRADMTPGEIDGEAYDGVMRDIIGNHLAIVSEGRAGPDVVVGDSKENSPMAKTVLSRKAVLTQGAVAAFLAPKLAADEKIDIAPAFVGVTAKNYTHKKPSIIAEITKRVSGKLAQDADLENLPGVLDSLDNMTPEEEPAPLLSDPVKDADPVDPIAALSAKMDAMIEAIGKLTKAESAEAPAALDEDPDTEEDPVDKPAMDAAITAAVKAERAHAQAIREAEKAIRPYVGELAIAQDSADSVYKSALEMLGVDVTGVHPSAYPVILHHQPKPGAARKPAVAQDSAVAKGFADRYPGLAPVRII
ncbi:DUF2213 domain-containing protein [Xanthobacter agilis]|uniref:DUF2213 domain-containing protein n=1 Tax=Xanthobacter agilis TaxID=47492 RepID=A0ABU0LJT4_XANAG|nr:DUF2213 domain-containing protein [Xanthobacter agilis]MDQ0507401.1 hypothetical protein [Xanthobacter agilis]